jgi:hypothetical protein
LGYEKGGPAGRGSDSRDGYFDKTVICEDEAIEIAVPRDSNRRPPVCCTFAKQRQEMDHRFKIRSV